MTEDELLPMVNETVPEGSMELLRVESLPAVKMLYTMFVDVLLLVVVRLIDTPAASVCDVVANARFEGKVEIEETRVNVAVDWAPTKRPVAI